MRLYSMASQQSRDVTTDRNDCYSTLYFAKWHFSVTDPLKSDAISHVSSHKFNNLPRLRAAAASAETNALTSVRQLL